MEAGTCHGLKLNLDLEIFGDRDMEASELKQTDNTECGADAAIRLCELIISICRGVWQLVIEHPTSPHTKKALEPENR
jgi:hypothetical protein